MINPYKIKKWSGLALLGTIPAITLAFTFYFFGLWYSLAFWGVSVLLMIFITNLLLKNPFSLMLEGKGLLCFDMNSTGIIRPFILSLSIPFVQSIKNNIKDVWDRASTFSLNPPIKVKDHIKEEKGGLTIRISEKEYNSSKFGFIQYPVLIYNSQLKSLITKEWLSEKENKSFVKHHLLYTNRLLEDLNNNIRDFGRYVVESIKPGVSFFQNKWVWIILVIAVVIMIILFGKPLLDVLSNTFQPATNAVQEIANAKDVVQIR